MTTLSGPTCWVLQAAIESRLRASIGALADRRSFIGFLSAWLVGRRSKKKDLPGRWPRQTNQLRCIEPADQTGTLEGFPDPPAMTALGKAQLRPHVRWLSR